MRVFDVCVNILKCMYSTRFRGGPTRLETSQESQPAPIVVTPLIRTMVTFHPDKYKKRKKESQKTHTSLPPTVKPQHGGLIRESDRGFR